MKNYLLAMVLFFFAATPAAFSQLEVKANPLGIIWGGDIDLSVEYIVSPDFGIEARIPFRGGNITLGNEGFDRFKTGAILSGRYYFKPELGGDNFYAGVYGKYFNTSYNSQVAGSINDFARNRVALGLLLGYKWVSDKGILVDINLGLGRALYTKYTFDSEDIDEAGQEAVIGLFEGLDSIIKIDLMTSLAVGYRFGLGSRKR